VAYGSTRTPHGSNVRLAQQDRGYLVHIEDDGDGFDPPEMLRSVPGHLGLSAMREPPIASPPPKEAVPAAS
jgi:hypothetical protein